jgi:hypothetical protein
MGVVVFDFCLDVPGAVPGRELVYRPHGVFLADQARSAQKVLALAFDAAVGLPFMLTYLRSEPVRPKK